MKSPNKLLLPILAVLVCAVSGLGFAQQKPAYPAYVAHVNDFANVIDAGTEQRLETILNNFEKMSGAQIALAVVPSLGDRPLEEYANGLYRAWGIGAKSGANKNKGALLLVSMGDRKTRLEVGYGLEGDLPDGLAGEIIRRMRPQLQQGQTAQAMETGVRTLVDTLAEKWNLNVAGIDRRYVYRPQPAPEVVPISGRTILLMLGLFLLFIIFMSILARKARRHQARYGGQRGTAVDDLWWTAPIIFNRGGGGFGGGSWSSNGGWGDSGRDWGGDRGGGSDWGGFGGGDSGGGGASDSW
jgi:uncharacterized protein